MKYEKPPLTIDEQAERLFERGLACSDPDRLKRYLSHIGYYRLSAYWLPFEKESEGGNTRNHHFEEGTDFEMVLGLYVFDRKLRLLMMDAIERVEVAVRTRWAGAMALNHGAHSYMEPSLFKDPWKHLKNLRKLADEIEKSSETFVIHYKDRYKEPFLPPIWAVVETMSLGTLSHWISNTDDNGVKIGIARNLGLPTVEILEGVLHAFTPLRNVCAHHGRLWNRRFAMVLPKIKRLREQMIPIESPNHQAHYIYNYLIVMAHMKRSINPRGTWCRNLYSHLKSIDAGYLGSMGFPENWEELKPWAEIAQTD